ncbi:MAG: hypothetical protein QM811_13115 [Pirellulales bacterium]
MADVLAVAGFVIGTIVTLTALMVWVARLLPRPVERAGLRLRTQPLACFLAGLLVLACAAGVFFAGLYVRQDFTAWLIVKLQALSDIGGFHRVRSDVEFLRMTAIWSCVTPFLAAIALGIAGFARLFELRVASDPPRPLASLTAGAFCTSCAMFLPFIGWYLIFPLVLVMAAGAGMLSMLSRRDTAPAKS